MDIEPGLLQVTAAGADEVDVTENHRNSIWVQVNGGNVTTNHSLPAYCPPRTSSAVLGPSTAKMSWTQTYNSIKIYKFCAINVVVARLLLTA